MSHPNNDELLDKVTEILEACEDDHIIQTINDYIHTSDMEGLRAYIKGLEAGSEL